MILYIFFINGGNLRN